MAGGARELLRQVRQRRPALPARGAGAHEVVLLQRLPPLLDGGGGEGGGVHVGDLLALGDRLGGEAERAVAVIDPPVQCCAKRILLCFENYVHRVSVDIFWLYFGYMVFGKCFPS